MPAELRSGSLIARDRELMIARAALERARAGSGGVLAVTGEAGIGKSRLLDSLITVAGRHGWLVLTGRAVPGSGPLRAWSEAVLSWVRGLDVSEAGSLRPYRGALGRLVPAWADAQTPPPVADPLVVLGEGVLELCSWIEGRSRGAAGVLVVLEDLHWADPETLGLFGYVSGVISGRRLLLVGSVRSDEPGAPALLARWRRQPEVELLPLGRLADDDAARLVSSCVAGHPLPGAAVDLVVRRAAGLPLLVEELLTALVENGSLRPEQDGWSFVASPVLDVPAGLSALVAERLSRLPPDERRVLEAAAVVGDVGDIGDAGDIALLADVCATTEDDVLTALRAGVDANLLSPAAGGLGWRHALSREAVAAGLLAPERAALARRAADALAGRADPSLRVAELRAAAGQPAEAGQAFVDLARAAADQGSLHHAEGLLQRAVQVGVPPPRVAAERVRVATLAGRAEEALELGGSTLPFVTGEGHAELCLQLAQTAVEAAHWTEALGYVERSGLSGQPVADAIAADAYHGAAAHERAAGLAATVLDAPDVPPEVECRALEVVGRVARLTDPAAAEQAFRRAAQVAAAHGLVPSRARALHQLGTLELAARDTSPALRQARELAQDAGLLGTVASIDLLQAEALLVCEGPRPAAVAAGRSAQLAGRLGLLDLRAVALLMRATALSFADDWGHAEEALRRATGDGTTTAAGRRPELDGLVHLAHGLRPLLARNLPVALDHLDAGIETLEAHGVTAPLPHWGLWALARSLVGDRDEEARAAVTQGPGALRAVNQAAVLFAEAVAAGRKGWPEEALHCFTRADALLPTQHWWRRLLRLLALEAAVRDGWGDPVTELRADLSAFETGGDRSLARTSRDLLRQAGVPVRRGRGVRAVPPRLRALGVTSREVDVLALVAEGLTNVEVARRLVLSPRTIDHHVSRLLAKTGSANRGELARVLEP